MPLIYEEDFKVLHSECDPWDRMTPGAVLRRVQEMSTAHCDSIGMDEAHYEKTHTAFMLSRISLQVQRIPMLREPVRIQTRAYGMHRAVYQRVTTLYGADGQVLCEADSRWVLVDTQTRHILRAEPEGFDSPFMDMPGAEEHDMGMPKKIEGPAQTGQFTASYSLCDRNGHMNNTRYADVVCDLLPIEKLQAGPVRRMLMVYRAEIAMGDGFDVAYGAAGENGYLFVAEAEGRKRFECYTQF